MKERKKQEIPIIYKLDDLFTTQEERDEAAKEKVEQINISLIDDFENHPFKVEDNKELGALKESINDNGILTPAIIRKKENGRYEMISGHRRKFAASLLGIEKMPCIIKDLTDDEATIFMVDSNMARENLLPSERAFAYKMKYDSLKHQGKRNDLTSGPVDQRSTSEIMGDELGEGEKTIRRYIRLTYLIPELIEYVDNGSIGLKPEIAIRPAVEISYLKEHEQYDLLNYIDKEESTPSLSQAKKLKELSLSNEFDEDSLGDVMNVPKPNQVSKIKIDEKKLYQYVPKQVSKERLLDYIYKACDFYTKHLRNRDRER